MRIDGTVKFFNQTRGFGFITPDKGEKDVLVHGSALAHTGAAALKDGDKVSFEIEGRRTRAPQKSSSPSRLSPELRRSAHVQRVDVRSKRRPSKAGGHR